MKFVAESSALATWLRTFGMCMRRRLVFMRSSVVPKRRDSIDCATRSADCLSRTDSARCSEVSKKTTEEKKATVKRAIVAQPAQAAMRPVPMRRSVCPRVRKA